MGFLPYPSGIPKGVPALETTGYPYSLGIPLNPFGVPALEVTRYPYSLGIPTWVFLWVFLRVPLVSPPSKLRSIPIAWVFL